MPPVSTVATEAHDAALLRRIVQQDRRAFEELYNSYHRRLSRFLLRLAPRFDFAEEIHQRHLLGGVWCKASEFRGASRVSTWIMGIAYRRALRALRSARQNVATLREPLPDAGQGIDYRDAEDMRDWVAQALGTLPDEQRLALELSYFMGHSCEEIALITNAPVGTVKARMFHARGETARGPARAWAATWRERHEPQRVLGTHPLVREWPCFGTAVRAARAAHGALRALSRRSGSAARTDAGHAGRGRRWKACRMPRCKSCGRASMAVKVQRRRRWMRMRHVDAGPQPPHGLRPQWQRRHCCSACCRLRC